MKYRRHRISGKIYFLFVFLFAGLAVIFSSRIFYIRRVECFTQLGVCSGQISGSLNWLLNRPLLRPISQSAIKAKLENFTEISGFHTYRRLPGTLVISIVLRQPIGLVGSSVLGAKTAVDEKGYLFSSASVSGLPLLITPAAENLPPQLRPDETKALQVMSQLSPEINDSLTGELQQNTLTISFSNSVQVLVDISKPVSSWSSSLHLILARSKIMAKLPRSIDLRFNNPVVTY